MQNPKQQLFSSITGFESSYEVQGAEADGWRDIESIKDLESFICYELIDGELTEKDKASVLAVLHEYRDCDSGSGHDYDVIFSVLSDEE